MSGIKLRDYQRAAIDSLYAYWNREKGNPLIVAPCGAGKSIIIAQFIREAMQYPNTRILVLTHRQELLVQDEAELQLVWPGAPSGFYSSGLRRKDRHAPILFAGIQSVWKRLHTFDPFDLVIIDEAHLIPPKQTTMYGQAMETLRMMNPQTRYVGLTATPFRLDSGLLHEGDGSLFDRVTYEIPVRDLIDRGELCEVVGKRGAEVADLSGVRKRGGEFINKQAEAAFDVPALTQAACEEIVAYGENRRAWLIFASGIKHAEHVREALRAHGVDAEVVHGGISSQEREGRIQRFKDGDLRCLINVDVLTIGFNAPICDMGVLLRATASTALYVQIVGRLMRTFPGKANALLLDYGGNVERHGPIDKVKPKAPTSGEGDAPAKLCPSCYSIVAAGALECGDCGHQFPERTPKHERTAYGGAVMSHQDDPQWVCVDDVTYHRHRKAGKPDSVRIEYRCGLRTYKDWWLPEHKGMARTNTIKKLWKLGVTCPETTDELLEISEQLPQPEQILIRPEGKYERVESTYLGREEAADARHTATA